MADYYPLLAKAAAGLSNASPDARQAMYQRARKALLGQLRNIDPPVAEEDIERESTALDAAIARVESELAASSAEPVIQPPLPPAPAVPPPRPPPAPEPVAAPLPLTPPLQAVAPPPRQEPPLPRSEPLEAVAEAPFLADGGSRQGEIDGPAAPTDLRVRSREPQRPPAPMPPEAKGRHKGVWILGGVMALVVAAVAAAALKLRDSPEDLARLKPVAAATSETTASGKIAERVGRDDTSLPAASPVPNRATTPAPVPAPALTQAATTVTQAPIPVAQRAALLVEAPDLETKVRTFLGSSVWRLDNVAATAGQPLGTAVHTEVDVPEAKVRISLDLRKNTDPALPASSTIEIRFTLLPGSALSAISQISVPQMRREENPNGEALAGVPVKITDTYFLVGLAQGDFATRNADLLRTRSWIDIPIQLADNRIAKLTIEKGATGDRILADALTTWSQ